MCDMVTVECIVSKKIEGQTNKQTYKWTNQRRQSPYSRRATMTFCSRDNTYNIPMNISSVETPYTLWITLLHSESPQTAEISLLRLPISRHHVAMKGPTSTIRYNGYPKGYGDVIKVRGLF